MPLETALSMGVDVGGTNIRFGVFSGAELIGETRLEASFSKLSPENSAMEIVRIISQQASEIVKKNRTIQAVGIGFPGFIHPETRKILQSPNLPGLSNFDLRGELSRCLAMLVVLENDANAAAYGEYCLAHKPAGGLIYLGLGTGVGGGFIDKDGKLYAGQHGVAMEIGHMIIEANGRQCGCGNKGCMEQYASASGVAISYFQATKKQDSAANIAQLAQNGDHAAIEAYQLAANALAQALASIVKIIDVKNIVIGGGLTGAWELMQAAFSKRLEADLIPALRGKVQIKVSTANDQAGMLGAAMLALSKSN